MSTFDTITLSFLYAGKKIRSLQVFLIYFCVLQTLSFLEEPEVNRGHSNTALTSVMQECL